jgi:hypothetical protein
MLAESRQLRLRAEVKRDPAEITSFHRLAKPSHSVGFWSSVDLPDAAQGANVPRAEVRPLVNTRLRGFEADHQRMPMYRF